MQELCISFYCDLFPNCKWSTSSFVLSFKSILQFLYTIVFNLSLKYWPRRRLKNFGPSNVKAISYLTRKLASRCSIYSHLKRTKKSKGKLPRRVLCHPGSQVGILHGAISRNTTPTPPSNNLWDKTMNFSYCFNSFCLTFSGGRSNILLQESTLEYGIHKLLLWPPKSVLDNSPSPWKLNVYL